MKIHLLTFAIAASLAGTAFAQPGPQGGPDGKGPRGEGPRLTPEQRQEMRDKYEKATPEERDIIEPIRLKKMVDGLRRNPYSSDSQEALKDLQHAQ